MIMSFEFQSITWSEHIEEFIKVYNTNDGTFDWQV